VELKKELAGFSHAQLVKSLKDRGLSAQGSSEVLIERLAEAVVAERWVPGVCCVCVCFVCWGFIQLTFAVALLPQP